MEKKKSLKLNVVVITVVSESTSIAETSLLPHGLLWSQGKRQEKTCFPHFFSTMCLIFLVIILRELPAEVFLLPHEVGSPQRSNFADLDLVSGVCLRPKMKRT